MAQKLTKTAWKARKRHTVILPSGVEVQIELPNLPLLIKTGRIPNELIQQAVKTAAAPDEVTREQIEEQYDFYRTLVVLTVKDPELTPEDVDELPFEDVEMIVEFATRARDMDAAYRHLGGLEKVDSFRDFRGL